MPYTAPKTPEEREHAKNTEHGWRWELVVGKELKDWATRVMVRDGISRKEARQYLLKKIERMDRPWSERIANLFSRFDFRC
jgi:hypothetical protein